MKKSKIILFILAVLFIADFLHAKNFVSFNGRYTNLVYSMKNVLWKDNGKYSLEKIQNECKKHPENADAWFVQGYYWQHQACNYVKAAEYYKKSMESAPNALKPQLSYIRVTFYKNNAEELFNNLTNSFRYIKNYSGTFNWSLYLNYFKKSDTNYLDKLYVFLLENKNKIPEGDYSLIQYTLFLGKDKETLTDIKNVLEKTKNKSVKNNLINTLINFTGKLEDFPELMTIRNQILDKYQSPYERTMRKMLDERTARRTDPEIVYRLGSNAFELATEQWQRIAALESLMNCCLYKYKNEMKYFVDRIINEKTISFNRARFIIKFMKAVGETNDLYHFFDKKLKGMPEIRVGNTLWYLQHTYTGKKDPVIYKSILKLMLNRYPSSYRIVNNIADIYQNYDCDIEELSCRKKLLKLTDNEDYIPKQKSRIAELIIKSGKTIDTKDFIVENKLRAEKSFTAAKALSTFYLLTGKSNDAFNILKKCADKSSFPYESKSAFETILNIEWGILEEKALDYSFEFLKKNIDNRIYFNMRSLLSNLTQKYMKLNRYDKSFDVFLFAAENNLYLRELKEIIKHNNNNVDYLVDKIISANITQSWALVQTANEFAKNEFDKAAYKIRDYYINLPNADNSKYKQAGEMLGYAFRQNDTNLCYKIVDKIDGLMKQKLPREGIPHNITYHMRQLDLIDMCNSWIDILQNSTTGKAREITIQNVSSWYIRTGNTNKLIDLIKENNITNMSVEMIFNMLPVHKFLNFTNQYNFYVDEIGKRITNSYMVRLYGSKYLYKLRQARKITKADYEKPALNFMRKWIYNENIPISLKYSLIIEIQHDELEFADYLLKNKSKLSFWQLHKLAYMCVDNGMTNKGIELSIFALNKPDIENDEKIRALLDLADFYNKNEDFINAVNSLNEIEKLDISKKDYNFYIRFGNYYANAFVCNKAVDSYIKAIEYANQSYQIKKSIDKIISVAQNDSEINLVEIANGKLRNMNDSLKLFAESVLLFADNKSFDARKRFDGIFVKLKNEKEQYILLTYWKEYARKFKNYNEELKACKQMYKLADDNRKQYLLPNINRLLIRINDYDELLKFNSQVLNSLKDVKSNERSIDLARKAIAESYLHSGKTNAAWDVAVNINNSYILIRIAVKFNKTIEVVPVLIKKIQIDDANRISYMANWLINYYITQNDNKSINNLTGIIDGRLSEMKPESYMEISIFYLRAGQKNKAKELLKKYYDNAEEKDKEQIRQRIDRILNMNSRRL